MLSLFPSKLIVSLALSALLIPSFPRWAEAEPNRSPISHGPSYYRYSHHSAPTYGKVVFSVPRGSVHIDYRGNSLYYFNGTFYRRHRHEYMMVPPPVGARVYGIPVGYDQITVNGSTFFFYNGVYYQRQGLGFVVVNPPSYATATPDEGAGVLVSTSQAVTVNIPKSLGGYVAVTIRRSGSGFIGPQGEYYDTFPKVEQLRLMYGH